MNKYLWHLPVLILKTNYKNNMKKIIISILALSSLPTAVQASGLAEVGIKTISTGLGYAIGQTQNDKFEGAGATGAAVGLLVSDWGYKKHKKSVENQKMEYYLAGIKYQRWGQANKHWHTYTLDPNTGKPPAFTGLDFGNNNSSNSISTNYNKDANKSTAVTKKAIQVPVVIDEGKYGGIQRTKRTLWFPKLP